MLGGQKPSDDVRADTGSIKGMGKSLRSFQVLMQLTRHPMK